MVAGDAQNDNGGSVDREAATIIRGIIETTPPKSIETIKAAGDVAERAIIEERVRRRAYEMWEADGRPPGDGMDYWIRAESELLAEAAKREAITTDGP